MENLLSKQVFIYSLSTDSFLNDKEHVLHLEKQALQSGRKQYKDELRKLEELDIIKQKHMERYFKNLSFAKLGKRYSLNKPLIDFFLNYFNEDIEDEIIELLQNSPRNKKAIRKLKIKLFEPINDRIKHIEVELDKEAESHKGIRTLRKEYLTDSNKVAQFYSVLTRALGVEENETTTDIIMIRAYRYKIFESLVKNGFKDHEGNIHQYFTSSAGNIRNKKSIFIKKSVFNDIHKSLFAGLTRKMINDKGGMNVNKYNAYTALTMTSSVPWEDFDITKCIVVDDFETDVKGWVDYINSDYKINPDKKDVTIPHMDGAGIMLESVSEKAMQFRLPFFKGLLIPTKIHKFLEEYEGASPVVKDIYGRKWNIIEDNISIIFTKSQFKAWSFFKNEDKPEDSWLDFIKAFNDNNCEAAIASVEPDTFEDKALSYQVLQTLTDMTDRELETIASKTKNDILNMGKNKQVMMETIGITDENENKNSLQQATEIYPNLLNDEHNKQVIKDTKKSMIERAKSGKLLLEGNKRTFIAPDVYAFMEWLFANKETPEGLLDDGEVSCGLYDDKQKLDVLRSPHLFREHSVNVNKVDEETEDWFITNCIFTSVKSHISKLLMFDVDGDDSLIVSNSDLVEIAERNMKDIRPLDYKLASAKPEEVTNDNIYDSLIAAYKKNIGEYSNLITCCWNSKEIKDEKQRDEVLNVIRWLTYENNSAIDYAKTLWMPTRPPEVDGIIKKYTGSKLPYFFKYAKGKSKNQIEKVNNIGVNRLDKIIPNTNSRIVFEKVVDEHDYKMLLNNASVNIETDIAKEIIKKYDELNRTKHNEMKKQSKLQGKSMKKVQFNVINKIKKKLREIKNDDIYITDVLVKYLYEKESPNKDTLWDAFGKVIVWNLNRNVNGIVECLDCQCEIDKTKQRQVRCLECQKERNKYLERERKRRNRKKKESVLMSF